MNKIKEINTSYIYDLIHSGNSNWFMHHCMITKIADTCSKSIHGPRIKMIKYWNTFNDFYSEKTFLSIRYF